MRKSMLIGIAVAITIVGGMLSAIGHKTDDLKQSNTTVIDTTALTLAGRNLPTVQVDEPF
jgi:hypothetical protein